MINIYELCKKQINAYDAISGSFITLDMDIEHVGRMKRKTSKAGFNQCNNLFALQNHSKRL